MEEGGLRARKKAQARAHIAATAARLFGTRGYENVAVRDVAAAAEVSEQTVYNYFPTKQDLALDRRDELRVRLASLVADRAPEVAAAAALRPALLDQIAVLRASTAQEARGELPALTEISPTLRRLALEARDQQASAVAAALTTTDGLAPAVAKAYAAALVSVFQQLGDLSGPRLLAGDPPAQVADDLEPVLLAALDDLARRLSPAGGTPARAATPNDDRHARSAPPCGPRSWTSSAGPARGHVVDGHHTGRAR